MVNGLYHKLIWCPGGADFESFEVPEEIHLSHLCLAGLGRIPLPQDLPEDDLNIPDIHVEMYSSVSTSGGTWHDDAWLFMENGCQLVAFPSFSGLSAELSSFLQSINELMVDMPPEMD